jgi:hypothetical protein
VKRELDAAPGRSIRALLGGDVFVNLDAPHHVSLFAYDNRTFIVQNFQSQTVSARVSVTRATGLHDVLSGRTIAAAQTGGNNFDFGGRGGFGSTGTAFEMAVPAHSFRVFQTETNSP